MELFSIQPYQGKRVCVALSGGIDSVCLLHAFYAHAETFGVTLSALHIEHGIRGESSLRDAAFCAALCDEWGIPLRTVHVNLPAYAEERKLGLEEAGREVRYNVFREELQSGRSELVATAHHKNDIAETVLFRLARGTSLSGMRTITEYDGLVRPLLGATKAQIKAYAAEYGLLYSEDETNADEAYSRNFVRHSVLPAFERISKNATEHLVHFASLAAQDDEYLYALARREITEVAGDYLVPVSLPEPLFSRACIIGMQLKSDYTGAHVSEIAKLKNLQSGKKISLPHGMEATREYGNIVFYQAQTQVPPERPFLAEYGGMVSDTNGKHRVDLDAFPQGCIVRTRREGDYIVAFGGQRKSLKKYLTDKKISARLGRKLLLIAKESEVFVVLGVDISDKVKVTAETKRIGYLG